MDDRKKMKYVKIQLKPSVNEQAEARVIADFNARYEKMSNAERNSDTVQDELELLWEIRQHRDKKTKAKVELVRRRLLAKGMIGLTEKEWAVYKRTGKVPVQARPKPKSKKKKDQETTVEKISSGFMMLIDAVRQSNNQKRGLSPS